MTLQTGTRLGPYEIVAPLGAGGMGEVYRTRDGRLGRDVAIKVLPAGLAADAERLQRFEQEARAAAALNHPNILALYDIGTHDGAPYLVTELLEGETLRDTLSRGLLPVRKAIEYAVQIAHGLAAAHERGIVHRDLKPENVFVTEDGRVKILDFGLAKLTQPELSLAGVTALPTTPPNTLAGVVLGTVGYMSPEQVRGLTADHRSDLFAFGVVLYEMLSGTRAFHGDTAMDAMTAILKDQPAELAIAERNIPPALVRIVERCLEKSPAARFQSTRDLAFALESLSTASTPSGATEAIVGIAAEPRGRERTAWTIAVVLAVVTLASLATAAALYLRPVRAEQRSIGFVVAPPEGWTLNSGMAMSPDGLRLAFNAKDKDGRTTVWVRSLDTVTAQPLKGTENAGPLFWSPDSRFLAFVADGKLKKIDVAGGPPQVIADEAAGSGWGARGSWGADGTILFKKSISAGLSRVSATGGPVSPATALGQGETRHISPCFLPDGQHFLYGSFPGVNGVYVGSLNSNERKQILQRVSGQISYAQGRVFFNRAGTLMAQGFDTARLTLTGEPSVVADIGTGGFDVSSSGVLAYRSGMDANRLRLAWFDRNGQSLGVLGEAATYYTVEISPDGSHAVGAIAEQNNYSLSGDVWRYDLTGDGRTRLTFDATNTLGRAVWAPDGKHIVYVKIRPAGGRDLFQRASDGAGDEHAVLEDGVSKYPLSWSSDGRFLLYEATPGSPTTGKDVWVLPLVGDRKPFPYLQTRSDENFAQFSPDGRWVAYQSDESGRLEVYVAAFPGAGGKRQVSTTGGEEPRWRRDGKEVFYLDPKNTLMAAAVNGQGASFEVASVKALFETRSYEDFSYDVSADGQRFLMIVSPSDDASTAGITVVVNGDAGIKK